MILDRPAWRWFVAADLASAARHVQKGGFAAVGHPRGRLEVLLPRGRDGKLTELALWALLAIDLRRWRAGRGEARGLASVWIKTEPARNAIIEWFERDATSTAPKRKLELDCLRCGACCRDNRAVVEPADLRAWRRAERRDLLSRAYLKRSSGQIVLRLSATGRCLHLDATNHCRIYELRPSNCRAFPAGSEACLAARLETLGVVD